MKFLIYCMLGIGGLAVAFLATAARTEEGVFRADLESLNAAEAIAAANEWKWTRKDVKSYVDSREAVLEFADGTVKRIPLPDDKMLVAVAPYVQRTHQ